MNAPRNGLVKLARPFARESVREVTGGAGADSSRGSLRGLHGEWSGSERMKSASLIFPSMSSSASAASQAASYDAWYDTPRGRWIGETEFRLLRAMLRPDRGESLIDLGSGTGYFTRRFASVMDGGVVGIDPDEEALAFARAKAVSGERYEPGRAESLPFADGSFDLSVSVAAFCFIPDERRAVREMLRITKRRFAIGLLNRHSLLWRRKGRKGGSGGYAGAKWHSPAEAEALFEGMAVRDLEIHTAVFLPGGGWVARALEPGRPSRLPWGAFLCVSGEVVW